MILTANNTQFLKQVFVSLEALDYCVLRNYETLPETIGKDIDILVSFESVIGAVERVKSLAADVGYTCLTSDNELNGFNLIVVGDEQKINIHFQLWVSFETNIIYKKIPGLSEKIVKNQVRHKAFEANGCAIKIPSEPDELLLLLRQLEFKNKITYEKRIFKLVSESDNPIVLSAKKALKLNESNWVSNSSKREALTSRLIWKIWKKDTLKNFFQATIFVIKRKI